MFTYKISCSINLVFNFSASDWSAAFNNSMSQLWSSYSNSPRLFYRLHRVHLRIVQTHVVSKWAFILSFPINMLLSPQFWPHFSFGILCKDLWFAASVYLNTLLQPATEQLKIYPFNVFEMIRATLELTKSLLQLGQLFFLLSHSLMHREHSKISHSPHYLTSHATNLHIEQT